MSPPKAATTTREMYDQALKYARDFRVPHGVSQPCSTSEWLPENVALLEKYHAWLSGGGTSDLVIRNYHLPMAGHVLGLNHKPSEELDPEQDFQKAMEYILAKGHGPSWQTIEAMGSKIGAKHMMRKAGVPVLPGTPDGVTSIDEAKKVAAEIGYPVIVKASAGGGGIGMQIVHDEEGLEAALATGMRIA